MNQKLQKTIRSWVWLMVLLVAPGASWAQNVFINEFHYDNTGGDTGEFVEIAGPAGTDLTSWSLVLYNGGSTTAAANAAVVYNTRVLSGIVPNQQNGYGTLSFAYAVDGIQNGAPDGIALVNPSGVTVQFLSYEGVLVASGGPASGQTSVDIGVSENNVAVGQSLQLKGTGATYSNFAWAAASTASASAVNTGQTFAPAKPTVNLSVSSNMATESSMSVSPTQTVTITATASAPVSGDQIVDLATTGSATGPATASVMNPADYYIGANGGNGTITIPDGQTSGSISFNVIDDTDVEGTETATLTLTDPSAGITLGSTITQSITIIDDDAPAVPTVSIAATDATGAEAGLDPVTFQITRTGSTTGTLDVNYTIGGTATNGTDYTLNLSGSVTIPVGQTTVDITLTPTDDMIVDANETIVLTLTDGPTYDPVAGSASATATITDNDVAPATLISAIQGSGSTAALTGTQTIEGIVTRTFASAANLNGFYVQEEDADSDNNPLTSEGIFVFDPNGAFTGVQGSKVRITGTVAEFTSANTSLTQLRDLTSVVNLGASTLPTVTNVQFPVANVSDLERYEGMLVNASAANGNLTVTEFFQLGRFGQVVLSANGTSNQSGTDARLDQFTQFNMPSTSGYAAYLAEIAKRRIILDDGRGSSNPDPIIFGRGGQPLSATNTLRGGDGVASITAVLDERFEGYRLQTSTGVDFRPTNPRPTSPPAVGGSLKVVSFNVLNYFNGNGSGGGFPTSRGADNQTEFTRQRDKILQAISGSGGDMVGLIEIEKDGFGSTSAIQDLVNGLNATSPNSYTFIDPATSLGSDEITVGIIYKPAKVTPVGAAAVIPNGFGTGSFDVVGRKPLAQTFRDNAANALFTAVVNHFKSKGSSSGGAGDADANDGQGLSNGTRTRQSQDLVAWLATNPTGTTDPDYLLLGDFNAYALEDPIKTLVDAGYADLVPNTSYSFVFDGQVGSLDYALANGSLRSQVTGAEKWHINADEPNVLDYNTEFKSAGQISSLYNADQFRSSDHDPVVVGLSLIPAVVAATPLSLTFTANPMQILTSGTTTLSATVSGGTTPYTYTFSGPGTINASGNTATVSGLSAGEQMLSVMVTDATSPTRQTIIGVVSVTVTAPAPTNTAPTTTGIANQMATVGQAFSLNVASSFSDAETSNNLMFAATGLPMGLTLSGSTISGTPSMSGVSTVTVTATDPGSLSVSTSFQLTVNPATVVVPPTVGPFSITGVTTINCETITASERRVSFNPQYAGTNGQPITFSVQNELSPTTNAGPYTLRLYTDNPVITLRATQQGTAGEATFNYNWLAACNGGGSNPPANTAPTTTGIANQMTTVGQAFSLNVASSFSDAETPNNLTFSATGLPMGLTLSGSTISGTPSMSGVSTVTVTATDPGNLMVSTSFQLTANPATVVTPPTGPFSITGVTTVSCQTVSAGLRTVNFNPRYAGTNGQTITFSVVNELSPTTALGPYTLNLYTDNPTITLKAMQQGTAGEATFSYNWLAACDGGGSNPPANTAPTTTGIANQMATVGQAFSLNVASSFSDAETPNNLTFSATGLPMGLTLSGSTISGTPSMSGVSTVTVTATDPGNLMVSTSFQLTVNPAPVVVPPTGPFSITGVTTVSCQTVSAGLRTVNFNPQYAGTNGQTITFSVVNELSPTTALGPYTLNLYTDNPTITLKATQQGTTGEASFSYNWLAACNASANSRIGVGALVESVLDVRVIGNPVQNSQVRVEVRGAGGQPLRIQLTDMRGQVLGSHVVEQAGLVEQRSFEIGRQSAGLLLLRATTPTQSQMMKVLRAD